ncbi:MAG: hypothetical protein IJT25_03575 [Clostridia bacterium]|nr:hypothetical protein [Clostridia bacterium]
MKKISKTKNIILSLILCLAFGLIFCLPNVNIGGDKNIISEKSNVLKDYVSGFDGSSAYLALNSNYAKLTEDTFSGTISTSSVFTVFVSNSYTNGGEDVSYSFSLAEGTAENSTKFNFGVDTSFTLLDFSNTRNGMSSNNNYTKTIASASSEVALTEFANGANVFAPSIIQNGLNNERFQFIISFGNCNSTDMPTAGETYYFIVYRNTRNTKTAIGYKEVVFTDQATSFAFTSSTLHQSILSDSTENFTLNFNPSNANSSALNGVGSGVRLKINSPANTTLPSTTSFVLKYNNVQQGDSVSLEKSFAFDFTQSSTMVAEVMIPYNSGLADGNYTFAFEVFDRNANVIATATQVLSFINVNYKVRATSYVQDAELVFHKSVVYTIGESLNATCHIEENLPEGSSMKLRLEKRQANQSTFVLYDTDLDLEITQMRTRFASVSTPSLQKVFHYGTSITAEMVLRFHIEVYDRNGDLQSTTNCYFAVVEPTE